MFKRFMALGAAALIYSNPASAACNAYPYNLTNGTTANAIQVMADFNCAALTGNGLFTGNVGINTVTPTDMLDVAGPMVLGGATERLSLNNGSLGFNRKVMTGAIYNSSVYAYQMQHTGSSVATSDFLAFQVYAPSGASVTGLALTIDGTGRTGINGTPNSGYNFFVNGTAAGLANWVNASDARLKTNVTPITDALALISRLQGVRYEWLPSKSRAVGKSLKLPMGETQLGFVAQDVEKVLPEAVVKPTNAPDAIYGLKEGSIVPVLVEAMKEQQAEIDALKSELAALKAAH